MSGIMAVLTRSSSTSALTYDAPFGTDRVSNDLVATEGGFAMPFKCAVEGCESTPTRLYKGWCGMHYQRWRRWGDPTATEETARVVGAMECTHRPQGGRCVYCFRAQKAARPKTVSERLWPKVDVDGPVSPRRPDLGQCWLWLGSKNRLGYGHLLIPTGRWQRAHRAMYELVIGPIPSGLELDHLCFNPPCVNPFHMEPVTHYENNRRSNSLSMQRAARTHCPQGHPYDDANTIRDSKNRRSCRTCKRERGWK